MLELRQAIERDAAIEHDRQIRLWLAERSRWIAYYAIRVFGALVSFAILTCSFAFQHYWPTHGYWVLGIGFLVSTVIVLLAEFAARTEKSLTQTAAFLQGLRAQIQKRVQSDYLVFQYWVSLLLWIPFVYVGLNVLLHHGHWISAGSRTQLEMRDSIIQALTIIAALLAIQATLFVLILGTLVGKYSGRIAGVIVKHPAVCSVFGFGVAAFSCLTIMMFWGYPSGSASLPSIIAVLSPICLLVSIWVCLSGCDLQKAIRYVGVVSAGKVRRYIKPPITQSGTSSRVISAVLAYLNLDWRDPYRLVPLYPSPSGVFKTERIVDGLTNAANKAIQDNDLEMLDSALRSMYETVEVYVQRRDAYRFSNDELFRELNNHIAILMSAASKCSNEGLITRIIEYAGGLARLSLLIGSNESLDDEASHPRDHSAVTYWVGLLKEGFQLAHNLKRSTAASKAITELRHLTSACLKEGYVETAQFTCLPAFTSIHTLCLQTPDAYHQTLATECLNGVLGTWLFAVVTQMRAESHYSIDEAMITSIQAMAQHHMQLTGGAMGFANPVTALVQKVASDEAILQDVFFGIGRRENRTKNWQASACVRELSRILQLVTTLASIALRSKQLVPSAFADAFFEMGYCVFHGIPKVTAEAQKGVETTVLEIWQTLASLVVDNEPSMLDQWLHPLFGLLGYATCVCSQREDAALKDSLSACIRYYCAYISQHQENSRYRDSNYLSYAQLAGAWANVLLGDVDLGNEVAEIVVQGRKSGRYTADYTGSVYGMLGYPLVQFQRFYMPYLMNIRMWISNNEWADFKNAQEALVADDTLVDYGRRIIAQQE